MNEWMDALGISTSAAAEQQLYLRYLPLNADLDATRLSAGLGPAWRYSQISRLTNLKVDSHSVQQLLAQVAEPWGGPDHPTTVHVRYIFIEYIFMGCTPVRWTMEDVRL